MPVFEQPVRDIDYRKNDVDYVMKEDSKNVPGNENEYENQEKESK